MYSVTSARGKEDISKAHRDCHENNTAMEIGYVEENSVKRVSPPAQPAVVKLRSVTYIVKPESKSPIPCPNRPQILTLRSDQV